MPTTCGFPNCKFRSRYRGLEDNRHFYRIPKRPQVLRQRWLRAIGRTEETVVSQLRICSAHFQDGEKKEGDIPVPDPAHDTPISIQLPPKETKTSEKRRQKPFTPSKCYSNPVNSSLGNFYERLGLGDPTSVAAVFANALKSASESRDLNSRPDSANSLLFPSTQINGNALSGANSPLSQLLHPLHVTDNQPTDNIAILGLTPQQFAMRPLVALLDGRDCTIEMSLLKELATVAFCDAQTASEIHQRVLNEAVVALAYHSIQLDKEDLKKFKHLKALIRIGPSTENIDLETASELGIAVCNTPCQCIEEQADSTLSFILNLYRRTVWLTKNGPSNTRTHGIEGLRELASGSKRPSNSTLLIIGLGNVGMAVASRAKAFGFTVSFYDPNLPDGIDKALGLTRYTNLEEAVANADCISLHCPPNSSTKEIINMQLIKKMKKGVYFVNINSDQLVVQHDLLAALRNNQIAAAALDIQTKNNTTESISTLPNVITTPKMAWYSEQSCRELREAAALEARKVLKGEDPFSFKHCVNPKRPTSTVPSTSPISQQPNTSSSLNMPNFSTANNFLGFPNFVNPQMMMWPGLAEKPLFANLLDNAQVSNAIKDDLPNGRHNSTPQEDRPSSSTSTPKEQSQEKDNENGGDAEKLGNNLIVKEESGPKDDCEPPLAKMIKTMDEELRA